VSDEHATGVERDDLLIQAAGARQALCDALHAMSEACRRMELAGMKTSGRGQAWDAQAFVRTAKMVDRVTRRIKVLRATPA
jgi:hypothetical protein